ncbi:Chaperone protein ClpB [Babesia sp. Xinjiang]|uniref:Chaperone protein ClpB n=1 Tax=Babesia sp. Xinjiang TaxID=462227 RepID=UPI000A25DC65|nr:Chaperone protein ClpB [Babesia sp. Xinjiang]ORM40454.1 Chaperone protein ClpB [Babesia sp. Xinjiang]
MYNIKIPILGGWCRHQLRQFGVWRRLFPVCELSSEVSNVLRDASRIAREAGSGSVESEFLVKSLLQSGSLNGKGFRGIRLPLDYLGRELDAFIQKQSYATGEEQVASNSASALLYAQSLALSRRRPVGTNELSEGLLKYDGFLRTLRKIPDETAPSTVHPNVNDCLLDLTAKARSHINTPFVGRERELARLKGSLNRMRKNNVLLVGDAGVGKTALVERFASDMLTENESVTVLSLDLCRLYSGHGARGELEAKLRSIFDTISNGNTVLFIDEIHHLIQNQESGVNVTNLFKPLMTSDSVKIIGSTTTKEYHQYFRRDRAFERRFEVLRIRENNAEESLAILHGIRPALEKHHQVKIDNEALLASVELSMRFIPKRHLPDKAIDLLDEASILAKRRCSISSQLDKVLRRKNRLIATLIRNERHDDVLTEDILQLEKEEAKLRTLRDAQRELHVRLGALQQQQHDHEKNGDLVEASELKNRVIPEVLRSISQLRSVPGNVLDDTSSDASNLVEPKESKLNLDTSNPVHVTKFLVANVVSQHTGIPEAVLMQSRIGDYKSALETLKSIVLSQEDAINRTLLHVYKHTFGFVSRKRIGAALCYVGPHGVGKRTLLRNISLMFGMRLKHIAGSHLVSSNATNILVGSPPGYVGHREGGMLCEWIKEHPYSVVVFEGAHLMHANVVHLLVGAIDNGFLVDCQGEECDISQCFFVFTSGDEKLLHQDIRDNVDDIIPFNALSNETVEAIIRAHLAEVPLIKLRATAAAVEHLRFMIDENMTIPRVIDRIVGTAICRLVLSGAVSEGSAGELRLRCEVGRPTVRPLHITDVLLLVLDNDICTNN